MRLKLNFLLVFLILPSLVTPHFDEDYDSNTDDVSDDGDNDIDEPINVCGLTPEDSICQCDGESLICDHQFIHGENLNTADLHVKKDGFISKKVCIRENSLKVLKKGYILPGVEEKIETLDFSKNLISKIESNAFDAFDSLTVLRLDNNLLKIVNTKIFTNKLGSTLKELYLSRNKIEDLSAQTFYYLTELETLNLEGNRHLEIDSSILSKSLSKLTSLSLSWCDLRLLEDDTFINLKSMTTLRLVGNPFTTIPKAIQNLPQLKILDFTVTNITRVPTNAFVGDNNLTHLQLGATKTLVSIEDCAFCGLPHLEELSLSRSKQLNTIHENALGTVSTQKPSPIKNFYLSYCNISTLPEKLFHLTDFKSLSIVQNPFVCDCSLAWLINNPKLYGKTYIPKCRNPPALNNTYFTSIAGSFCNDGSWFSLNARHILWLFVILIIGVLSFFIFQRRHHIVNSIYRIKETQNGYHDVTPVNL